MGFEELNELFLEDEEINLHIDQAHLENDILTIAFTTVPSFIENGEGKSTWVFSASAHRVNKITLGYAGAFTIQNDHPLLWKYTDTQCELYFSGASADLENLVVDLLRIDTVLFGNYQAFGGFLNGEIVKLLTAGHGLLARGPKRVLEQYSKILQKYRVTYSMTNERPPTFWDGEAHVPETPGYKIVLFKDVYCYVVAKFFELVRS